MVAGMTVGRHVVAYVFVVIIPEIQEDSLKAFSISSIPPEVGDKIGAILTAATAIGSIVFPYACSLMNEGLDYRLVTDIFGLFGIGFAILYILIVYEKGVFSSSSQKVSVVKEEGQEEFEDMEAYPDAGLYIEDLTAEKGPDDSRRGLVGEVVQKPNEEEEGARD